MDLATPVTTDGTTPADAGPCPSCGHAGHPLALCENPTRRPGGLCGCPGDPDSAAGKLMAQLDPGATLAWHRANMGLDDAIARLDGFISVGRRGWSDPVFLAALERVRAAAAQVANDERDVPSDEGDGRDD
jgi:hypothetical protein